MAVRYKQKKKDEVVAFVNQHNAAHGRGGQSVAAKKFGISPITVAAWLKKAEEAPAPEVKQDAPVEEKEAKEPAPAKAVAQSSGITQLSVVLKKMMSIQEEIESLQGEYETLKQQL